jgi:hypothetical protein
MKHNITFLIWCLSRTSIKTSRCLSLSGIYLLLDVAARGAGGKPATVAVWLSAGMGRRSRMPGWESESVRGRVIAARTSGAREGTLQPHVGHHCAGIGTRRLSSHTRRREPGKGHGTQMPQPIAGHRSPRWESGVGIRGNYRLG